MGFLKFSIVVLSLLVGTVFLAAGLGVELNILEFNGLKTYGIPIGVAFLIFGVAIAKFWVITEKTTHIRTEEETGSRGKVHKSVTEITEVVKKFNVPPT